MSLPPTDAPLAASIDLELADIRHDEGKPDGDAPCDRAYVRVRLPPLAPGKSGRLVVSAVRDDKQQAKMTIWYGGRYPKPEPFEVYVLVPLAPPFEIWADRTIWAPPE